MPNLPQLLIFKEDLLPPSETFILAQMQALKRFSPNLVGLEPASRSLPLPVRPILLSEGKSTAAALRAKMYRRTGFAPRFHRRIMGVRANLIHAHFASGGRTLLRLNKSLRLPLVVTLHGGSDVPVRKPQFGIYRELGDKGAVFICVSEFIRKLALEAGYPPEKLVVHYIGVDRALFAPSPCMVSGESIQFVGRLVEMKGCEYLLRALRAVQARRPGCELTVVGDGPLRGSLEALAKQLKVRCQFLGLQKPSAVRQLMTNSRLFCLPSVTLSDGTCEGLPTVLAEAQASGLPVIGTLHSGIPEVIKDNVTGLLVPERDTDSLAAAITRLLEDTALWQRFHLAAQQHIARNFDLHRQTALLEDIYASQIGAS